MLVLLFSFIVIHTKFIGPLSIHVKEFFSLGYENECIISTHITLHVAVKNSLFIIDK